MLKFNVKTSTLPPPPSLTSGKGFGFAILVALILLSSVVMADPFYYTNETVPSSGTISTTDGDTFNIVSSSSPNPATFGGAFSGSGAVSKIGDGDLIFQGAEQQKFTGTLTVSSGSLALNTVNIFGNAYSNKGDTIIVKSGATLSTNNFNELTNSTFYSGAKIEIAGGHSSWGAFGFYGTTTIAKNANEEHGTAVEVNKSSSSVNTFVMQYTIMKKLTATFLVEDVTGDKNSDFIVNLPFGKNGSVRSLINKSGTGTMEMTAANTYDWGTTISAGTLKLSGAGTLGSGSVSIAENATLEFAHTADKTFSNTFSGKGNIDKTGSGTLTFTGDSGTSYQGTITVSNGTLALNNANMFGKAWNAKGDKFVVKSGAKLSTNTFNELTNSTFYSGSEIIVAGGYDTNWGAFSFYGTTTIAKNDGEEHGKAVVVNRTSTSDKAFIMQYTINSKGKNTAEFLVNDVTGDENSDFIVNVPFGKTGESIEGVTSLLNKSGSGTMELTVANSYNGGTTISAGTLKLSGDGTLGTGSTTIADGAKLEFSVGSGETRKIVFGGAETSYDRFYSITGTGNSQIVKSGNGDLKILLQAQGQVVAEEFLVSSGRLDVMSAMYDGNNYAALDADIRVLEGAMFSPGNSVGYVDVNGNVILESGSQLLLEVSKDELGTVSYDTWSTEDNYTIFNEGSFLSIVIDDESEKSFSPYESLTITLPKNIQYQGKDEATAHAISSAEMQKVLNSYYFNFTSYEPSTGMLVVYTDPNAVPEPSTWALLILGMAGLMWLRRKK